jgi:hypothetical protein
VLLNKASAANSSKAVEPLYTSNLKSFDATAELAVTENHQEYTHQHQALIVKELHLCQLQVSSSEL